MKSLLFIATIFLSTFVYSQKEIVFDYCTVDSIELYVSIGNMDKIKGWRKISFGNGYCHIGFYCWNARYSRFNPISDPIVWNFKRDFSKQEIVFVAFVFAETCDLKVEIFFAECKA